MIIVIIKTNISKYYKYTLMKKESVCLRKKFYKYKETAEANLNFLINHHLINPHRANVYYCKFCNGYHIGHFHVKIKLFQGNKYKYYNRYILRDNAIRCKTELKQKGKNVMILNENKEYVVYYKI